MNLITGVIADNKPIVKATVKDGRLVFSRRGKFEFIVDTGFTGDLLIPHPLVKQLNLDLLSYGTFELATEQLIELPVFRGNVVIGQATLEVEMVPGDALIGMSLMQAIGSQLLFDFDKGQVLLRG
jgi:predicted aspartyl protease